MSRRNVYRPLVPVILIFQIFAVFTFTKPLATPISLLNVTITSTASPPNRGFTSQNAASPSLPSNMLDYRIVGTPLLLRITEVGRPFTGSALNEIMDRAIQVVVRKINTGFGNEEVEKGRFGLLTRHIELHLIAIRGAHFIYFTLGDVLAGIWQYENEPWSSNREIVFDVISDDDGYIGYGRLSRFQPAPEPSASLSGNINLAQNEIE